MYGRAASKDRWLRAKLNINFVIRMTKNVLLWGVCLGITSMAIAKLSGSLAPDAIAKRLQPMAEVNVLGAEAAAALAAPAGGAMSPKDIYENNCKMCHQTGVAGAPKFGNKDEWAPRIAQGLDTIVKAAITGIRAMPPKGNCLKCTPDDIKSTVEYMVHAAQ
jgi:cytochrome c5